MKLSLSFKNSEIKYLGNGKYDIIFNIGNKILNRLNEDTRIFIESFTHCEYKSNIDNHDLTGSFEIRCDFINSLSEYDNEDSLGSIIYRDNMINYKSFVNTAPLHVYNYKLNTSAFLNGRLHFEMDFFDHKGDEFISYNSIGETLDTSDPTYVTFINDQNTLNNFNTTQQQLLTTNLRLNNELIIKEDYLNDNTTTDAIDRGNHFKTIVEALVLLSTSLPLGAQKTEVDNILVILSGNDKTAIAEVIYLTDWANVPYSFAGASLPNVAKNHLIRTFYTKYFEEFVKSESIKNLIQNVTTSTSNYVLQNVETIDAQFKKVADDSVVNRDFLLNEIYVTNTYNYTVDYTDSAGTAKQATGTIDLDIYNYGKNLQSVGRPYKLQVIIKNIVFGSTADDDFDSIPATDFKLKINETQFSFDGLVLNLAYLEISINKLAFQKLSINEIPKSIQVAQNTRDLSYASVRKIPQSVATNLNDSIIDNLKAMSISFGIYEEAIEPVGANLVVNDYSKHLGCCRRL